MQFRFYDKPGLWMTPAAQHALRQTLLHIAATSLRPVPDYQCLSSAPDALDDKLIVVAHAGDPATTPAIAFTSAFFIAVSALAPPRPVLHTGLTVVDPAHRRRGVVMQLFAQVAARVFPRYGRDGLWVTCLAEVPSSLGLVTQYLEAVFPSPEAAPGPPPETHRAIARAVSEGERARMLISPGAVLDEERFVFRGSNDWSEGECFKKDPRDERWLHREPEWNRFFSDMLKAGSGDEVLQVGFCSRERAEMVVRMLAGREMKEKKKTKKKAAAARL
ncbi:hypothetical protein B0J12DRAFT_765279 [Macrophomina phaseolina]|uniref:N-acetyltransferase domain-containing protein n=1 Tax=Macrophomina phaseolina TaxID=35725 RepID=A0ABQ8FZ87_9PEZI|nr:hypothetical protein B0J12DRAFT_765279 [Macrophomina phaseolina]